MTGPAPSPEWVDRYVSKDCCAFCQKQAELQASHILPAFVFRWLKNSGGTGYLRDARTPNRRAQDGIKIKLLCRECEQLFSGFERQFADKLFLPYTEDDGLKLVYGDWLARFCATLSWRVLVLLIRENRLHSITAAQSEAARAALATWEGFIRGDISNPGFFEQHVLPLSGISETTIRNLPNNMNRYLRRAVEFDFPSGETSGMAMTFAKIGPLSIFGYVVPPDNKWLGTKIAVNRGTFGPGKFILPVELLNYIKSRAVNMGEINDKISPAQRAIIEADFNANIDRFRSSGQFQAMMEDLEMFGRDVIIDRDQ